MSMNLESMMLREKEASRKDHRLYDCFYMMSSMGKSMGDEKSSLIVAEG